VILHSKFSNATIFIAHSLYLTQCLSYVFLVMIFSLWLSQWVPWHCMYIHIYFLFSCFSRVSLSLLKSTAEIHYQCPALFNSNKPKRCYGRMRRRKKIIKFIYSTHAEPISHVNCIFLSFSWDFLALSSHFNTFFFSQSPGRRRKRVK